MHVLSRARVVQWMHLLRETRKASRLSFTVLPKKPDRRVDGYGVALLTHRGITSVKLSPKARLRSILRGRSTYFSTTWPCGGFSAFRVLTMLVFSEDFSCLRESCNCKRLPPNATAVVEKRSHGSLEPPTSINPSLVVLIFSLSPTSLSYRIALVAVLEIFNFVLASVHCVSIKQHPL